VTARISNRERDRILARTEARLAGAEALVHQLALVWWGRLALRWALGRIGRDA
jgi:hypothetical protein